MTVDEFVANMQTDIGNEYKHMLFYLHASVVLQGPERMFAVEWLNNQASEEMTHVRQFGDKIASFGVAPVVGQWHPPINGNFFNLYSILEYALAMEEEVIRNYHDRVKQAETLYDRTGKHYDLVLFYEEQLEHSQHDADEIVKLLKSCRK